MIFRVLDALPLLVLRFGATVNKVPDDKHSRIGLENKKVMGFATGSGKALGLDVYPANMDRTRLWIEQPAPPAMSGITILKPKRCADLLRGTLNSLADGKGIYIEADSKAALESRLSWYS